jgi:hypothetical protein
MVNGHLSLEMAEDWLDSLLILAQRLDRELSDEFETAVNASKHREIQRTFDEAFKIPLK